MVGKIDRPGDKNHGGSRQRHKPALSVKGSVIEGKGHRKYQHTGGGVAKPFHHPPEDQITPHSPHEGAQSVHPRTGAGHKAHPKGGKAPKDLPSCQHGPQQKPHPPLGHADQGLGTKDQSGILLRRGPCCLMYLFPHRHICLLLCKRGLSTPW